MLSVLGILILYRAIRGSAARIRSFTPRLRTLGPLGVFAGFLDAAGGGGWGPVTTSTLMAANRMEPRYVIGSVSASEFLVAVGASIGFLIGLGSSAIAWDAVAVLLAGGLVAAPIAAFLVRHIDHRTLGAVVAGMILFSNSERVLALVGVGPAAAELVRVAIAIGTVALTVALYLVQRRARTDGVAAGLEAEPA
jgi:uncharacterized membrane protein YfcA